MESIADFTFLIKKRKIIIKKRGGMDEELQRIISSLPPDYQKIVLNMSEKELEVIFGIPPKRERKTKSIVELYKQYTSVCYYCTPCSPDGQVSFGMDSVQMTVQDYQDLIDKGWRRSGNWVYHPCNHLACCPSYTIRLDVKKFKASKAQKHTLKKFRKFLNREKDYSDDVTMKDDLQYVQSNKIDVSDSTISSEDVSLLNNNNSNPSLSAEENAQKTANDEKIQQEIQQKIAELEILVNSAFEKAIQELHISSLVKERNLFVTINEVNTKKRSKVKGYLSTNICLRLKPFLSHPHTPITIANTIISYLPPTVEATVEGEGFINFHIKYKPQRPRSASQPSIETLPFPAPPSIQPRIFEFSMEKSSFTQEKFDLYKKYQSKVHKANEEELTEKHFTQFLVNSPLISEKASNEKGPEEGYGSFHQLYRIDGKLIAVGVVDVLPKCLSSVYFFYDPEYSFLGPGVLSALTEINWVSKIVESDPSSTLTYYYMGYYIHSCPKMKYKAGYQPSDLLCPITNTWWPLSSITDMLNDNKFTKFAPADVDASPVNENQISELIPTLTLLLHGKEVKIENLTAQGQRVVVSQISPFIRLVGCDLASRFAYKFN